MFQHLYYFKYLFKYVKLQVVTFDFLKYVLIIHLIQNIYSNM
jgi:hypothetical protein